MSTIVINSTVGITRGTARIWLEGRKMELAGFKPGQSLALKIDAAKGRMELRPVDAITPEKEIINVSRRQRGEREFPLLELKGAFVESLFRVGAKIRVAMKRGYLVITRAISDLRIAERLLSKLASGKKLAQATMFHGGGVLDKSLHSGLQKAGVDSFIQIGSELEDEYMESSLRNNPELWSEDSFALVGDVREFNVLGGDIPQVDFLSAGIPCTGASKSGRSKNKLSCAEEHSAAGSMFFDFLQWLKALNPAVFLMENVPEYLGTASMMVIRSVADSLGYTLHETVLDGNELGALERRKRMCVVGWSRGLEGTFDFADLVPLRQKEPNLGAILEEIPLDSDRWKSFDYLAAKEERDMAAGKGFARQLLTPEAEFCGTIGKGYSKCRSTEPFVVHPTNPKLSRLLTPTEHARVKGAPEDIIAGLPETTAHEILGQSVIYCAFEAVGYLLGQALRKTKEVVLPVVEAVTPTPEPMQGNLLVA